jgi:hypothetical protein
MKRIISQLLAVGSLLLCVGLLFAAAPSLAADEYIFDSALSLNGDKECSVSADDPVPDPPIGDCPSGDHPAEPFNKPRGFATDSHGNMYVSNAGEPGRIHIFDSEGLFISETQVAGSAWSITVDSEGYLYVRVLQKGEQGLLRFSPTVYNPAAGEIEYGSAPIVVLDRELEGIGELPFPTSGLAINPTNDHLLVQYENRIIEFSSGKDGNELLEKDIGFGLVKGGNWIAVDASRNRLYSSFYEASSNTVKILVFELGAPHALLETDG